VTSPAFLALSDRAFEALGRVERLSEEALLAHVYGGAPPAALRAQLAAPLLDDPRLQRNADGSWTRRDAAEFSQAISVLALATTGPTPGRGRIIHLAALHVAASTVVARFSATVQPGRRVPAYIAARLGLEAAVLNALPPLDEVFDDFVEFLAARPVIAQDALLTWSFVDAEARLRRRLLQPRLLLDLNELARAELEQKPSLARVAQHFGIAVGRIEHPDEEARVLALVAPRLMQGDMLAAHLRAAEGMQGRSVLRRGETARALPDQPGIYILRDAGHEAVYVGKARRLRSRMQAYVHRPLGPTRRLEGLVGTVDAVESALCETDLEALILEDREIRRLQPRFNTVRQQRLPRTFLRLPPMPPPRRAPRRIELSSDQAADGGYVGPFRNQAAAEQARQLAREVFNLDGLRRGDREVYETQLGQAWSLLRGNTGVGFEIVQQRQRVAAATADAAVLRQCERLLAALRSYELSALLLPADPRTARYAVVRPSVSGVEGFLLDRSVLVQYISMQDADVTRFAAELLTPGRPRTAEEDVAVVLRWLGAQRASARLLLVDDLAARDAIEDAALALLLKLSGGEA
jgi:DNA polymerase III epsilon subunit-like protein